MDTEQLFAADLDEPIVDYDKDEEIPATQLFDEEEVNNGYGYSQPDTTEIDRRRKLMNDESIPLRVRMSPNFFTDDKSQLPPLELPALKPISEKQQELRNILRKSMIPRKEVDLTLYNPNFKFERQRDETPKEVRELCIKKGIVKASEVLEIISQSQSYNNTDTFVNTEVLTQVRRIESDENRKKKSARWGAEDGTGSNFRNSQTANSGGKKSNHDLFKSPGPKKLHTEQIDFDRIDIDVDAAIKEQELLNNSLGSLSQMLSNSGIVAELIESTLSQSIGSNMNVDLKKSLEVVPSSDDEVGPSDDEESLVVRTTEDLEAFVLNRTFGDDDDNLGQLEEKFTGQLEMDFLNQPQYESQKLENEKPCSSKSLKDGISEMNKSFRTEKISDIRKGSQKLQGTSKNLEKSLKAEKSLNDSFDDKKWLENLNKINKNFPESYEKSSGIATSSRMPSGFSFASGKKVAVKESTRQRLEAAFAKEDQMIEQELAVPQEFVGRGFASGKAVKLKAVTMNRLKNVFEQEDKKIVAELKEPEVEKASEKSTKGVKRKSSSELSGTAKRSSMMSGTSYATPKLSEASTSRIDIDFESTPESSKPSSRLAQKLAQFQQLAHSPVSFSGFSMVSGKKWHLPEKNLKRFAAAFAQEDEKIKLEVGDDELFTTPGKPPLKKQRLEFGNSPVSSPAMMDNFKQGINQHSTPLVKNARKLTESEEVSSILELCSGLDDSSETIEDCKLPKFARKLQDCHDNSSSDECFEMDEIESIERAHKNYYNIDEEVKEGRKKALEDQRRSVADKPYGDRLQMAGSVFMLKATKKRKKLKEFVGVAPKKLNRRLITLKTVLSYKFLMENHVGEEIWKRNVTGLSVGDNARLIMNEASEVGVEEITQSFLTSPGVDPKLVNERWIENAFKMLVTKFSWLENSFANFERHELLSPENMLLQMKYRYDREIDRHHRPAIKKITELDDIPCRRMVLKVLEIYEVLGTGNELELTDGWYSIRATIDVALADACSRGKIEIGTKLMTSCAELVGCEGCDPLDMPGNVRLKIHANSTRRTTWDHKMGFCKNPNPIAIKLDSVLAMGGVIGKLRVTVVHIYSMIYVDFSDDKKEYRSEKMHRRLKNKLDVLNFSAYERIAHQVQQQELKELHARVKAIKKTRTKVEEMTVDELCDMLDAETECDESINVQKQLSKSMQRQVQAERDHRRQAINDKVRQKIGEESKKVKQLLKFRVVDAVDPKKTGIISWWSPTDELLDVIKVGRNLEIVNTAAGAPGKEIQISAGSSSSVKLIPRTKLPTTAAQFLRQETKIAEINENFKPANDEFDVACIVVRVETKTTNNYVKVYVVDEHREVLCINFFNSIEDYAYEDVVNEGQVMYVKNLQWRQTHNNEKPVQAFVSSDCTTFTIHPATEANKIRLQQLKEVLKHNPDFVQNCKQMFEVNKENHRVELNTSVSGPVFSKTLPSSRHLPYSKTPKTTSIGASTKKRLGMSGGPPRKLEMPKLDIRVVKPKFTKVQSYKQPSNSNRPNFKNSLKKSS